MKFDMHIYEFGAILAPRVHNCEKLVSIFIPKISVNLYTKN